jgi:hypothetical protein
MSDEKRKSRRGILKLGLAGVTGIAAGHSIMKSVAFAETESAVSVKIPHVVLEKGGTLSAAHKQQLIESIAPVMSQIAESSGIKLTEALKTKLKSDLVSRGDLELSRAASEGGYTIVLHLGSSKS